jgi:acetyltransferase-like isoleucine patch superfamily enzyme
MNYINTPDLKKRKFNVGKKVFISQRATIINPENLVIGNNVRIDDGVIIICKKKMYIGSNVHIAPYTIIRSHQKLIIKNYVAISSFVDIFTSIDSSFQKNSFSHALLKNYKMKPFSKPIVINSYSSIGSHSVILPGAHISAGTFIGALTLINFKTENWGVYAGNPARLLFKKDSKKIKKLFLKK